jgi:hypothetical protein
LFCNYHDNCYNRALNPGKMAGVASSEYLWLVCKEQNVWGAVCSESHIW